MLKKFPDQINQYKTGLTSNLTNTGLLELKNDIYINLYLGYDKLSK